MSVGSVSDYPSLLDAIRKRPGLYYHQLDGKKSIQSLASFLGGVAFSESFHGVRSGNRMGNFEWDKFEKWVEKKVNESRLSLNSLGLADYLSPSDSEAFDLWFSWYDQFILENSHVQL